MPIEVVHKQDGRAKEIWEKPFLRILLQEYAYLVVSISSSSFR